MIKKRSYGSLCRFGNQTVEISRANMGTLSELVISADLLARGYHVFRAVSPACPFDLVIYKNGRLQRVEVKTRNTERELSENHKMRRFKEIEEGKYDVYVDYDSFTGRITYLNIR